MAIYSCLFLWFYAQSRRTSLTLLAEHLVQAGLFLYSFWAVFTCATRVTDNWHHWYDVLGGVLLGVVFACVVFLRSESFLRKYASASRKNEIS